MVHVAHDHHNGCPGHQILRLILVDVDELFLDGDGHLMLHLAAHFLGDDGSGVVINDLGQGGHDAVLHQALDHLGAGLLHAAGQLAHADLIGDHDLDGSLLGDLQLQTAHLLRLVLTALVGEGHAAPALVGGADLFLAAAALALHAGGPLTAQILQTLVVLGQVHIAALAGVYDLLLGNAADGLLHHRLLLGRALSALALGGLGSGGLFPVLGAALLRRGSGGLGGLRLLLLLEGVGEDHLDAGDLVVLREIIKNHGKLMVRQNLHVVLGSGRVLGQDLRDGLGGQAEVLGHLMHSVFFHTQ